MFSIPQDVLKQLLSVKNTTPERLSNHELAIAARICHCTLCDSLWCRRPKGIPDRCPKCHKRGWDRPLLSAMLLNYPARNVHALPAAEKEPQQ
jgi:hypothetical protein